MLYLKKYEGLPPETAKAIEAFLDNPVYCTWVQVARLNVAPHGFLPFEAAVQAVMPKAPLCTPYVPDEFTARRALRYARTMPSIIGELWV